MNGAFGGIGFLRVKREIWIGCAAETVGRNSPQRRGGAELEGATVARAMPEMKNLDEVRGFIDLVVDQDWGVYELADAGPSVHRTADVREAF